MRFRSLHNRRLSARTSDATTTAARLSTPRPLPPPRAVQWRSLWSRVYARWATAPMPPTPVMTRPSFSPTEPPCDNHTRPLEEPKDEKPLQPALSEPPSQPPAGLRAYLQRKRGELWFLTKRRADGDLGTTVGEAEEVEVPPPPPLLVRRAGAASKTRPLQSLLSLTIPQHSSSSSSSSELEIDMASYSDRSNALDRDEDDGDELESTSDEESGHASDTETERDSYATATSDSDPFFRRYSSWCSIDDEQTGNARASDTDDVTQATGETSNDAEAEGEELGSRSPTLEELYGVHHVGVGATPSFTTGIWV